MRALRTYSLSNFPITTSAYLFYNWKFVPFDQPLLNSSILHPHLWQPQSYSLFLWVGSFFFTHILSFHSILWNSSTNVNQLSHFQPFCTLSGIPSVDWMMFPYFLASFHSTSKKGWMPLSWSSLSSGHGTCSRFHQPDAPAPELALKARDAQKRRP